VQYFAYTNDVITLLVVILVVLAFLNAEGRLRVILALLLLALLFLPWLFPGRVLFWVAYIGKVIFGCACYVYLKSQGFWSFGR
jgi:hypothetical protein